MDEEKSGSSTLQKTRPVTLLDQQFWYFRLPCGHSPKDTALSERSRGAAWQGNGMGAACYVWIGLNCTSNRELKPPTKLILMVSGRHKYNPSATSFDLLRGHHQVKPRFLSWRHKIHVAPSTKPSCSHLLHDRTVCPAPVLGTTARVTWPSVQSVCVCGRVLCPWLCSLSSEQREAESSRAHCEQPECCCDAS